MGLLIKDVELGGLETDVLIEGNRFKRIGPNLDADGARVVAGRGKAIVPTFVNMHTHASMALLRGYADDLELHDWLTNYIWPLEAKMGEEDIYTGARLACLEMIKSGTTCFNDMYWHYHGVARAVEEMGMRAMLSSVFIDFNDEARAATEREQAAKLFEQQGRYSDRIGFTLGPHAIYTVSEESLRWVKSFADEHGLLIHIHVSETEKEVVDCRALHGLRPVQWLEKIGLLGANVVAAHVIHVDDEEIGILARNQVKVVHNPASNMKLASGRFPYARLRDAGVHVSLGTDGCSSNNNLCMLEEMKFAALNAKLVHNDPTVLPAAEAFDMATTRGAEALGLDCGRIAEGLLADCMLVDLDNPRLVPGYQLIDDLVYSADSSCIDTVICDGEILMENGRVEGEEEIVADAKAYVSRFQSQ
ncbi:5-methylthioadenosine/S-adenosylhomocysteine deaminase [Pontiella desulfatans]|uniref:5-methylthioadenosine/S-adenosylhomocysteine deaminase n=1 Tax=Pontiella desulfatans TaxID=2750659 RepID=A0A6C2TWX7_PONDE|nr:amidohydrolase [Pontiella desulfatans]VGO12180.1 5-methylthioadenosine/S-adenosylhomocysteine deaminase [Pontiella desulfatans]